MNWPPSRRVALTASVTCFVLALAGLANGYRIERNAIAERDDAIERGVTTTADVQGSLRNRQRRTRVRLVVDGEERRVSVFADRPYVAGTTAQVAYLPSDPERGFIVGATPWTWWAAMRTLFVLLAIAGAAATLVAYLLMRL